MANEPSEAFKVYSMDHPNLPRGLRGRLAEHHQRLTQQLVNSQNWEDFKERRGRLLGLIDAIGMCEEIEHEQERR